MTRFLVSLARGRSSIALLSPTAPLARAAGRCTRPLWFRSTSRSTQVLPAWSTSLLAASPGFAEQCARIADARYVRVTINPVMSSSTTSRGSARTSIRRFASGALLAVGRHAGPAHLIDYAELFGHEFEHIIEQIERVDLDAHDEGPRRRRVAPGRRRLRDHPRAPRGTPDRRAKSNDHAPTGLAPVTRP